MTTSTDPSILLEGGGPAADIERAQEAVRRMRRMQPGLRAFARALTRNPRMDVVISPGNPRTDGERIYLRPPIELGDKTGHEMNVCGQRDERGIHLCPAHRVLEGVETTLYHEIAHIVYSSFEELGDRDKQEIITRRLTEIGTDSATRAGKLAEQLENAQPRNYLQAAGIVSPYLPMVLNALEDARVNLAMYRARPGTYKMFKAQVVHVFEEGIENADGTISFWSDMPRNAQLVCGLYAKAAGFDYRGWFSDEVVEALDDPALTAELKRVQSARTVKAVYRMGFSVLEHLRRLGFCKRLEDPEDDKLSEDTGEDEQNQQSPEGDKKPDQEPGSPGMPEDDSPKQPPQESDAPESRDDEENDGQDGDGQESEQDGEPSDSGESGDQDQNEDGEPSDSGQDGDGAGDGSEDGADADGTDGDEDSDDAAEGSGDAGDSDLDEDDGADEGGRSPVAPEDDDDFDEEGDGAPGPGAYDEDDEDSDESEDSDGDPETGNSGGGEPGENDVACVSCGEEFDPHQEGQAYNHQAGGPLCGTCEDAADVDDDDATETADDGMTDSNRSDGAGAGGGSEPSSPSIPEDDDVNDGTPEEVDRALKVFGGHAEELPTAEELANDQEIDRAIVQGDHFDEPSRVVFGVNEHRWGKPIYNSKGTDLSARWAWHERGDKCWDCGLPTWKTHPECRRAYSHGYDPKGYDAQVDDSIITAALGRLRVVFSDNRKARMERNLRGGRINARALGRRVPVDDDRLFQKKREPGAKDYFVVIGLDNSGSTSGKELGIIKAAAMHKAEMLARLGIDFAVYAHNGSPHDADKFSYDRSTMDLDIVIIKEAGERWCEATRERLRAVGPGGYNLDGHALEYYRKVCDRHRATDKVILYYTDGEMPNENYDEELAVLQREIQTCQRRGYSVVGVGIGTDSPKKHGLDTIRLDAVGDVPLVVKELERRIGAKAAVA